MGVVYSDDSEYGREMWRWNHTVRETHPADEDKPEALRLHGMRPATLQEYPKMLYKAFAVNGKVQCMMPAPHPHDYLTLNEFDRAVLVADNFTQRCQKIVHDELDEARAKNDGWAVTPTDALQKQEACEQAIGNAAAEAAHAVQRMTAKAKEEYKAAEAETDRHVTDVVPKKRGRPRARVSA